MSGLFDDIGQATLGAVLTVPEIMHHWQKSQMSVMMQIYKEHLIARQTKEGGVWLVLRASVYPIFGKPEIPFEEETQDE